MKYKVDLLSDGFRVSFNTEDIKKIIKAWEIEK